MPNEIVNALNQFAGSMQRYAVSRALQNANVEVNAIRESEEEDAAKQEQIRQVAQNLSIKMMAGGASPRDIQVANQLFVPRVDKFEQEKELIRLRAEEQRKTLGVKQDVAVPKEKSKRILRQLDIFNKGISGLTKSMDSVASVRSLLTGAKDPSAAQFAASELAKIGLVKASGESGRLSDQDLERAAGNPSLFRRTKRFLTKIARGIPPTEDVDEMMRLVDIAEKGLKFAAERRAKAFARQRAKFVGMSEEEFEAKITEGLTTSGFGAKQEELGPGERKAFHKPSRRTIIVDENGNFLRYAD